MYKVILYITYSCIILLKFQTPTRLDDYLWVAEDGMKMQAQILKSTLYTPFIQSME